MSAQLTKRLLQFNFKRRCSALVPVTQRKPYSDAAGPKNEVIVVEEIGQESKEQKTIVIHGPVDVSLVTGMPEEHIKGRLVRIYLTPKNAMQSGTDNVNCWEMEFDTRQRWENPLMGWSSTGDPLSNLKVQFNDKQEAVNFAEKHGYEYFIEPEKKVNAKVKSYGYNFSWNKRTRVSTK